MRRIIIFFLILLLFSACKKNKYGSLEHKIRYTAAGGSKSSHKSDEHYTQFGDYITSVTPNSFIGIFGMIRIYGYTDDPNNTLPVFMTLIGPDSPEEIHSADFTNNVEITVNAGLSGPFVNSNEDGTGGCYRDDASFPVLHVNIDNIRLVAQLPTQYNGVNLSQFNDQYGQNIYSSDSVINGTTLTVDMYPLLWHICDTTELFRHPMNFYFGGIDSVLIYSSGPNLPLPSPISPQAGDLFPPFIWSDKFSGFFLPTPESKVTETITSTIGFDNANLLQIYAGADNIPYNSDDIIVFAPNFWERIYVNVTVD